MSSETDKVFGIITLQKQRLLTREQLGAYGNSLHEHLNEAIQLCGLIGANKAIKNIDKSEIVGVLSLNPKLQSSKLAC